MNRSSKVEARLNSSRFSLKISCSIGIGKVYQDWLLLWTRETLLITPPHISDITYHPNEKPGTKEATSIV